MDAALSSLTSQYYLSWPFSQQSTCSSLPTNTLFLGRVTILSFLITKSGNTLFLDLMPVLSFLVWSNSLCQSAFPITNHCTLFCGRATILSFLIAKSDNTLFLDLMVSTIFPDKHQLTNPTTKPVLTPTNKLQTSNHKGLSPIQASRLVKQ